MSCSSRWCSVTMIGSRPMNSGMNPYFSRSCGCRCLRDLGHAPCCSTLVCGAPNPIDAAADALLDDLLQAVEGAAADEQDVGGVDLDEVLVRVLAPALRRHVGHRAFEDLQQRLLHALAGDVAGDRGVVRLARDLVDLVDVDDSPLRAADVEVGRLDQPEQDVLHVLAHVAGLGEAGRVGDGEGDVEDLGQGLRQVASCRSRSAPPAARSTWTARRRPPLAGADPLVVVVDLHREHVLRLLLPDHVGVELRRDGLAGWG